MMDAKKEATLRMVEDAIETVVPIDNEDDERLRHKLADHIRKLAKEQDDE